MMSALAISCFTTSNLPWFMDLTFQVPTQYCSLHHWTLLLSPVTSTTRCCFCFGSCLHFFWSMFPLISSNILGTYRSGESLFQCPIILPFDTVLEVVKARILKWFAIPFSSGTTFCQTSPPWPDCLGWPHMAWLSFTELDNTVVLGSDWLVSVIMVLVCLPSDALSQHYHLTWVFLTLDVGYLFTAAPAKHSCCSLPWTRGISSRLPLLTLNMKYLLWALSHPW